MAPNGEALPDRATTKIAPTTVRDVNDHMRIANDEIFAPVFAVRPYSQLADVIDHINQRPAPRVAFWYGPDDDAFQTYVRRTPFGGLGRSGMGHTTGRPGSTPSAIIGRWSAPTYRSASPDARRRHSADRFGQVQVSRCGWRATVHGAGSSAFADGLLAGPPVVCLARRAALDHGAEHDGVG